MATPNAVGACNDGFQCSGLCLSSEYVCDFYYDCPNGEDEDENLCAGTYVYSPLLQIRYCMLTIETPLQLNYKF